MLDEIDEEIHTILKDIIELREIINIKRSELHKLDRKRCFELNRIKREQNYIAGILYLCRTGK